MQASGNQSVSAGNGSLQDVSVNYLEHDKSTISQLFPSNCWSEIATWKSVGRHTWTWRFFAPLLLVLCHSK